MEDLVAVVDHVVDGEADNAAERLRVEQDDGSRDPGPQRQAVIGQEASTSKRSSPVLPRRAPSTRQWNRGWR